ncbi:Pyrrolo-quinoline quinone [Pirellula staleyi DSM 6068]|uniref:Pyrrolo-quinoline quinone n=1 Tax=Pirellula staleyi (strain ATCC 27377 / DSM 6068 / ICPB 4128) TaxID=530564 RepID=D2R5I1_PIRSD|nr:PQQ-binding-like beta-propeller repeat protein [Pirellula staleyi]ADB15440.1 Pyrrolo-quinoline quinone [Pirellula staleyi DSM 6068]
MHRALTTILQPLASLCTDKFPRLVVLLAALLSAEIAQGGDWPGILGPNRDGVGVDEKLADRWPAAGPKARWTKPLGSGYAGVSVQANRVIAFHRVEGVERIEALDFATGNSLWKADFEANYRGGIDSDLGPRCVPVISGNMVVALGAAGDLYAVSLDTGKKLWSQSLFADLGADEGYFGAGSTPIVVGDTVLVNVGARNAGIVGLELKTGVIRYKTSSFEASYASPITWQVQQKPQVIFVTRLDTVLVDPASGKYQNITEFGRSGPTVNAAMPLVIKDQLFLTASYGIGAKLLKLSVTSSGAVEAKPLWEADDVLSSQYATPVHFDGFLYGTHGREDGAAGELRCVDLATGKVRWKQANFGIAHVIRADDKLLFLTADGRLLLVQATPEKFTLLSAVDLLAPKGSPPAEPQEIAVMASGRATEGTRPLPALARGTLFIRTHSSRPQTSLSAYEVAP